MKRSAIILFTVAVILGVATYVTEEVWWSKLGEPQAVFSFAAEQFVRLELADNVVKETLPADYWKQLARFVVVQDFSDEHDFRSAYFFPPNIPRLSFVLKKSTINFWIGRRDPLSAHFFMKRQEDDKSSEIFLVEDQRAYPYAYQENQHFYEKRYAFAVEFLLMKNKPVEN